MVRSVPLYIAKRYARRVVVLTAITVLGICSVLGAFAAFTAWPVSTALAVTGGVGALMVFLGMRLRRALMHKINIVNFISYITVLALTIGTAAFILVLSVFNGFEGLVVSLYSSFYPDLRIESVEGKTFLADSGKLQQLRALDGVEAMSLVLEENALLAFGDQQHVATVKGVESHYGRVTGIDTCMWYPDEFRTEMNGMPYAVVGYGVNESLGIGGNYDDPFHQLAVYMPRRARGVSLMPGQDFRKKDLMVWGKFAIQDEFDQRYVFMPISFVQDLLQYPAREASAIEINARQGMSKRVRQEAQHLLGPAFRIQSQFEQNALLFKVMRVENLVVYLIFIFILVIVAFNMIGSLSMTVIEKKRDIGILKAMGCTNQMVKRVFLWEGVLQAGVSICFGFALALGLGYLQIKENLVKLSGGGTFVVEGYPVSFKLPDFVLVALIVLGISLLASLLPALRASRESRLIKN